MEKRRRKYLLRFRVHYNTSVPKPLENSVCLKRCIVFCICVAPYNGQLIYIEFVREWGKPVKFEVRSETPKSRFNSVPTDVTSDSVVFDNNNNNICM